jgi:hypothetical protein
MGIYADDYYRKEVMNRHGFDPGSMYADEKSTKKKKNCMKCGKHFQSDQAVNDHMRDYHKIAVHNAELTCPTGREENYE